MKQNSAEMIARLSRSLAQDFRIMALDAPEAPLFLAVAVPVDEGVTGLKPRLPAGRGMTLHQAMLAAGAEAVELRASLAQHHLGELQALPREDGLAMVTATDLLSGTEVTIPAQEVYLDCAAVLAEPLRQDAGSTGCAAGPDRESAISAALWECVERDALALWWHGHRPGAAVAIEVIDAQAPRLYWWLHERPRVTRLWDIRTDIGLPVVVAVASDPDGGTVAIGSAARPKLADAALAAVTELVQTEVSLTLAREAGDPEALDWLARGKVPAQAPGPSPQDHAQGTQETLDRLAVLGHQALAVEMTLPGDPLPTIRVLVPGLCAMGGATRCARYARLCPDHPSPTLPEPY